MKKLSPKLLLTLLTLLCVPSLYGHRAHSPYTNHKSFNHLTVSNKTPTALWLFIYGQYIFIEAHRDVETDLETHGSLRLEESDTNQLLLKVDCFHDLMDGFYIGFGNKKTLPYVIEVQTEDSEYDSSYDSSYFTQGTVHLSIHQALPWSP